jgi:hypothetical protein
MSSIYAPTHKIAKYVHQNIKELINLKCEYNIRNTMQFAENISKMKLGPEHKLLTMGIKDLYVKIPVDSILKFANKLLVNNRVEEQNRKEIIMSLKMITNQNCFQYEGKFYKPATGVAMGSPPSGTLAEIFIQELEQNRLKHLLEGKKIIYYNRYVDDIFMIYDQNKITPQNILEQFNAQHKNLQFTIN